MAPIMQLLMALVSGIYSCDGLVFGAQGSTALLRSGGESRAFNVGTSSGYSVREVVGCVRAVTGSDTPAQVCERRAGDPPVLRIQELHALCDWQPRWSDLDTIIRHAWEADLKYLATVSR